MEKIEIRKSIKSEVAIAVPLIYSSGPPSFEYVFKNDKVSAIDFLKYAFVRAGGEFSYDNHYSLYLNGKMVGIGSVFDAKQSAAFTMYDGKNILRFYRLKSLGVIRRGLQVEGLIELPKKNEIVLAHLGIHADWQGKGLGTKLINALMEKANKDADSCFVLDVSEENPRAKVLYNRLGFVVTKKNDSTLKNKYSYVADHFRMERASELL